MVVCCGLLVLWGLKKKFVLIYFLRILLFWVGLICWGLVFKLFLGSIVGIVTRGCKNEIDGILYVVEEMECLIIYVML